MTTQEWSLIVAGVGVLGGLAGAWTNHYLARSSRRDEWGREKKMQEYRELLTAISKVELLAIRNQGVMSGEEEREQERCEIEAWTIMRDRIFIANVVNEGSVRVRWVKLAGNYRKDRNLLAFVGGCANLRKDIMTFAFKDLGIAGEYRDEMMAFDQ